MLRSILIAAMTASMAPCMPGPSGQPTPQPSASPLKTIATIRASARCADIITHANSVISTALDNDHIIGQSIEQLHLTNLDDGNPIHRRNGLQALEDLSKTLMQQSRSADDEVKRLRTIAAQTKDPTDKKALKTFADQLGGVLWEQQKIARDFNGFLAYVDFHDMQQDTADQEQMYRANDPNMGESWNYHDASNSLDVSSRRGPDYDPDNPTDTQLAQRAADDFQKRTVIISQKENQTATTIDGAVQGCEAP